MFGIDYEKLKTELPALLKSLILLVTPQRNDLTKSSVYNSVQGFSRPDNNKVGVLVNFYLYYIDSGRAPHVKKVPIKALLDWIVRYKINTKGLISDLSLAFAIQTSIYNYGIKPRPMIESFIKQGTELVVETATKEFVLEITNTITGVYQPK